MNILLVPWWFTISNSDCICLFACLFVCLFICLFVCCLAMIRMAGSMETSTEVMKAMASVIKLPEIRKNMMDMAREMHKVSSSAAFSNFLAADPRAIFLYSVEPFLLTVIQNFEFCGPLRGPWTPGWEPLF